MSQDVYRALADPTRRAILRLLREQPLSAGAIAERFPQSRSTLSSHFAVLQEADLVETKRQGQSIIYHLNLTVAEEAIADLLELVGTARMAPRLTLALRKKARA